MRPIIVYHTHPFASTLLGGEYFTVLQGILAHPCEFLNLYTEIGESGDPVLFSGFSSSLTFSFLIRHLHSVLFWKTSSTNCSMQYYIVVEMFAKITRH